MAEDHTSLYPFHYIPGGPSSSLKRLRAGLALLDSEDPPPRILFIGTGRGEHPIAASRDLGRQVLGIDEDPDDVLFGKMAVLELGVTPAPSLKTMSPTTIDLPAESLDLVMVEGILTTYHRRSVLQEVKRVLRPGGIAVILDPYWRTVPVPSSVRELWESRTFPVLTKDDSIAILEEIGLTLKRFTDVSRELDGFYRQFGQDIRTMVRSQFEDMKHVKKLVLHYKHEIDMYTRFGGKTYMGLGTYYVTKKPL